MSNDVKDFYKQKGKKQKKQDLSAFFADPLKEPSSKTNLSLSDQESLAIEKAFNKPAPTVREEPKKPKISLDTQKEAIKIELNNNVPKSDLKPPSKSIKKDDREPIKKPKVALEAQNTPTEENKTVVEVKKSIVESKQETIEPEIKPEVNETSVNKENNVEESAVKEPEVIIKPSDQENLAIEEPFVESSLVKEFKKVNSSKTEIIDASENKKTEPVKASEITLDKPKKVKVIKETKKSKSKGSNPLIKILVAVVVLVGILGGVTMLLLKTPSTESIYINLSKEYVTLNYSDDIDLFIYVKDYSDGASVTYSEIEKKLGEQTITFTATKNNKKAMTSLTLNLIDNEAPTFKLTKEEISLTEKELANFDCTSYVDYNSFNDNFDSFDELSFAAACPTTNALKDAIDEGKNGLLINYELKDSSNNKSSKTLKINISKEN